MLVRKDPVLRAVLLRAHAVTRTSVFTHFNLLITFISPSFFTPGQDLLQNPPPAARSNSWAEEKQRTTSPGRRGQQGDFKETMGLLSFSEGNGGIWSV